MMKGRLALVGAVLLAAALGCKEEGSKRVRVSGEARFDGQPIPYGDVVFTPDGSKKNSGPQGIAQIRDGKYDTGSSDGKGVAGGPTIIRVTGFTAQGGKLICEYEYQADLPKQDGAFNIDVPKKAAVKKAPPSDI